MFFLLSLSLSLLKHSSSDYRVLQQQSIHQQKLHLHGHHSSSGKDRDRDRPRVNTLITSSVGNSISDNLNSSLHRYSVETLTSTVSNGPRHTPCNVKREGLDITSDDEESVTSSFDDAVNSDEDIDVDDVDDADCGEHFNSASTNASENNRSANFGVNKAREKASPWR